MNDLTIAAVLEHYGADLHRTREVGWQPVKCPFHEDRTASASVNLNLGGFRCHACGMSGDALKLIAEKEGLSRRDAASFAKTVLGASVRNIRGATSHDKPRRISKWRDRLFA